MPTRLAVFDFDRTLSCCHVFAALSGGDGGLPVPPPYARTERGQLARLAELDALPEYRTLGGFALAAFGGPERVAQLRALLDDLHAAGVECVICSKGFVGPLRRCLEQVGLLRHFTQVFGNTGGAGPTEYDASVPPQALAGSARLLGTPANTGWGSKPQLVAKCLRERGLQGRDAVFIDDTPSEVAGVQSVCATIQVHPPRGMGAREFELLRRWLAPGGGGASVTLYRPLSGSLRVAAPAVSRDTLSNDNDSMRVLSTESTASDVPCGPQHFQRRHHPTAPPAPLCPLGPAPPGLLPPGTLLQQLPELPRLPPFGLHGRGQGLYFPFFKMDKDGEQTDDESALGAGDTQVPWGEDAAGGHGAPRGSEEPERHGGGEVGGAAKPEPRQLAGQPKRAHRCQHDPSPIGLLQPGVASPATTDSKNTNSWPTEHSDWGEPVNSGERAVPVCCLLTGKTECNPALSCVLL